MEAEKFRRVHDLLGDEKGRARLLYVTREGGPAFKVRVAADVRALLKLILSFQATDKK